MNCGDEECMTEKTEAKEFAFFSGITKGRNNERNRILNLVKSYWCGESGCTKHVPDWETFIMEIGGAIK